MHACPSLGSAVQPKDKRIFEQHVYILHVLVNIVQQKKNHIFEVKYQFTTDTTTIRKLKIDVAYFLHSKQYFNHSLRGRRERWYSAVKFQNGKTLSVCIVLSTTKSVKYNLRVEE